MPNARPQAVTALLNNVAPAEIHAAWYLANKGKNRFYVINIAPVISQIGLDFTRAQPYFDEATQIIHGANPGWPAQFPFEYRANKIQINTEKMHQAKLFLTAVTIIVAMERAAADRGRGYNVYDHLRILPATYFIDLFDKPKLDLLLRRFSSWSGKPEDYSRALATLERECLPAIEQPHSNGLIAEMAFGTTATKYTCEKLVEFLNDKLPSGEGVGPVRTSGDPQTISTKSKLGTRNAASALRVPRTLPEAELSPCF